MRAWLMVCPSFLSLFWALVLIIAAVISDRQVATIIALTLGLPPSFYLSHRLCNWLWPDLFRKAAENAKQRIGISGD
jgi:hypothetical protein